MFNKKVIFGLAVLGLFSLLLVGSFGCGGSGGGGTPAAFRVVSVSPAVGATNVLSTTELSVTFNVSVDAAIKASMEVMSLDGLITFESGHTAGNTYGYITGEWSNGDKTFTIKDFSGWENLQIGSGIKRVKIGTIANGIKDANGNYLAAGTIWDHTLAALPGGRISGTVYAYDSRLGVVRGGAIVSYSTNDGASVLSVEANHVTGTYEITGLRAGVYTLEAEQRGWDRIGEMPTAIVVIGETTTINLTLEMSDWELRYVSPESTVDLNSVVLTRGESGPFGTYEVYCGTDGSTGKVYYHDPNSPSETPTLWTTPTNSSYVTLIDAGNMLILCSSNGKAYITGELGSTFINAYTLGLTPRDPIINDTIRFLAPFNGPATWEAITASGTPKATINGGSSWTSYSPGFAVKATAIALNGKLVAVGASGNAKITTTAYPTWDAWTTFGNLSEIAAGETINSISFTDDGPMVGLAVTESGTIIISDDDTGLVWEKEVAGFPLALNNVTTNGRGDLNQTYIVGDKLTVLKRKLSP
jgi:hypothetical protein